MQALVQRVLNTYLGQYIVGLNGTQLSLGVYQGDLLLENLTIRKDAMRELNLPFDVKAGYVGQLAVKIPYTNLRGRPVTIELQNLFILLGPSPPGGGSGVNTLDETFNSRKERALLTLQAQEMKDDVPSAPGAPTLVDQIIDNVHLVFKNVHIRYEDSISHPDHPFAVGILIESLESRATDALWNPSFSSGAHHQAYRSTQLHNLSLYWDSNCRSFVSQHVSEKDFNLQDSLSKAVENLPQSAFLTKDIKGSANLRRSQSEASNVGLDITIDLGTIVFSINHLQFKDMVLLVHLIEKQQAERDEKFRLYCRMRLWRPRKLFSEATTSKERNSLRFDWWLYACKGGLLLLRQQSASTSFYIDKRQNIERERHRRQYTQLWISLLTSVNVDASIKSELEELEYHLSVEDIRLFRDFAQVEIDGNISLKESAERVKTIRRQQAASAQTWYGWWFGSRADNSLATDAKNTTKIELSPEERKVLFGEVRKRRDLNVKVSRDHVSRHVSFALASGTILFNRGGSDTVAQTLAAMTFSALDLALSEQPGRRGFAVDVKLATLSVMDKSTPNPSFESLVGPRRSANGRPSPPAPFCLVNGPSTVISPTPVSNGVGVALVVPQTSVPFLHASFSTCMLESLREYSLKLALQPLDIIFNKKLATDTLDLFTFPPAMMGAREGGVANSNTLDQSKYTGYSVNLDMNIRAPQIIIPEDCSNSHSRVLVFDLGHLIVGSNGSGGSGSGSSSGSNNGSGGQLVSHPSKSLVTIPENPVIVPATPPISTSSSVSSLSSLSSSTVIQQQEQQQQQQQQPIQPTQQPIQQPMQKLSRSSSYSSELRSTSAIYGFEESDSDDEFAESYDDGNSPHRASRTTSETFKTPPSSPQHSPVPPTTTTITTTNAGLAPPTSLVPSTAISPNLQLQSESTNIPVVSMLDSDDANSLLSVEHSATATNPGTRASSSASGASGVGGVGVSGNGGNGGNGASASDVTAGAGAGAGAGGESLPHSHSTSSILAKDEFAIDLHDVQVLAAILTDDWANALSQSTSPLHVIDRFSVHCTFTRCKDREQLAKLEPITPSAHINIILPALTCSLSETKLATLCRCLSMPQSATSAAAASTGSESAARAALKRIRDMDRRLMVAGFAIDKINLAVYCGQDELKKLVGLNVNGVKVELQQRTYDERLNFDIENIRVEDHTQSPTATFHTLIAADGTTDNPFMRVTYTHLLFANVKSKDRYHGLQLQLTQFPIPFVLRTPARKAAAAAAAAAASHQEDPEYVHPPPHNLEVAFSTLSVNVNRRTIATLMDLLQASLSTIDPDAATTTPTHHPNQQHHPPPTPVHTPLTAASRSNSQQARARLLSTTIPEPENQRKFKLILVVGTLSLTLVRHQQPMAKVNLCNIKTRFDVLDSYNQMKGLLGAVSIEDLTPAGSHYRNVFSTTGSDMLDFEVLEDGKQSKSNRDPTHPAMTLCLKMSSVRCTFSRRFFAELANYVSEFQEMRSVIARMREAARGMIDRIEQRQTHVKLDVHINRPVVIIPRNSFSDDVLEADLGLMTISNTLKAIKPALDSTTATNEFVDAIEISIKEMNLYSARHTHPAVLQHLRSPISMPPPRMKLLDDCSINVKLERNLSSRFDIPNNKVDATMSNVTITATHSQYGVFMGVLNENLSDEPRMLVTNQFVAATAAATTANTATATATTAVSHESDPDQTPVATTDNVGVVVVGSDDEDAAPSTGVKSESIAKWRGLELTLHLDNVSLSLLVDPAVPLQDPSPLARFDFIDSSLKFVTFTDGTPADCGSETTIMSRHIIAIDTRRTPNDEPNCFREVLQPVVDHDLQHRRNNSDPWYQPPSGSSSPQHHHYHHHYHNNHHHHNNNYHHRPNSDQDTKHELQLEITYRSQESTSEVSVILNQARLFLALDWLAAVKRFLFTRSPNEICAQPSAAAPPPSGAAATSSSSTSSAPAAAATAAATAAKPRERAFKLVLSITHPELVVVEDVRRADSSALVLRMDSVIKYSSEPTATSGASNHDKLFFDLQNTEVFSCRMDNMTASALSIVDPCKLNLEAMKTFKQPLHSATANNTIVHLDVTVSVSSCGTESKDVLPVMARVSYKDIQLVLAIWTALLARLNVPEDDDTQRLTKPPPPPFDGVITDADLAVLHSMGFADVSAAEYKKFGTLTRYACNLCVRATRTVVHDLNHVTFFLDDEVSEQPELEFTTPFKPIDPPHSPSSYSHQGDGAGAGAGGGGGGGGASGAGAGARTPTDSEIFTTSGIGLAALVHTNHAINSRSHTPLAATPLHHTSMLSTPPMMPRSAYMSLPPSRILGASGGGGGSTASSLARMVTSPSSDRSGYSIVRSAAGPSPGRSVPASSPTQSEPGSESSTALNTFKLALHKCGVTVCFIDDCRGNDLPLLEIRLVDFDLNVKRVISDYGADITARLNGYLLIDFFNPKVSAWEPVLEKWVFVATAKMSQKSTRLVLFAQHPLELNATTYFISSLLSTIAAWKTDYSVVGPRHIRERFVPYKIVNRTGLPVTLMLQEPRCLQLAVGEEQHFDFDDKPQKLRHQKLRDATYSPTAHKITVVVDGWQDVMPPITVDRVGVFMHELFPPNDNTHPTARLVTEVSMQQGQKVIEMRSPLVIRNSLTIALDVRLTPSMDMIVPGGGQVSVPINLVTANVVVRPHGWGYLWTTSEISWSSCTDLAVGAKKGLCLSAQRLGGNDASAGNAEPGGSYKLNLPSHNSNNNNSSSNNFGGSSSTGSMNSNPSLVSNDVSLHLCASIERDPWPNALEKGLSHTLTILPPILLENLLPVPIEYFIIDQHISGKLASGECVPLLHIYTSHTVRLQIKVDGFHISTPALINGESRSVSVDRVLRLQDLRHNRSLFVEISNTRYAGSGGARAISLYSPYLMMNHTDLPLIYRQHLRSQQCAGQSDSLEELRKPGPAMFSCDGETLGQANKCCIKIDKSEWSSEIPLDTVGAFPVVSIPVLTSNGVLQYVYDIGVEITRAPGNYSQSKVVKFVPRYNIINGSDLSLQFAQSALTSKNLYKSLAPHQVQPFHWPSPGDEKLLCLRLNGPGWKWSCPFAIVEPGDFYIKLGKSTYDPLEPATLLWIEIRPQGASLNVIFKDVTKRPPFRIENRSGASICYRQPDVDVQNEVLPGTSQGYAWDDVMKCKEMQLVLSVQGSENSRVYSFMQAASGSQLRYSQSFYLIGPGTLVVGPDSGIAGDCWNVVLQPRRERDEGQLFKLRSDGRLVNGLGYCLEVDERTSRRVCPVRLRRISPAEPVLIGQRWKFEQERIVSLMPPLVVAGTPNRSSHLVLEAQIDESKPAMPGSPVVLGLAGQGTLSHRQHFSRERFPPGSGVLTVRMIAEGPTRVLVVEDSADSGRRERDTGGPTEVAKNMTVLLNLAGGLGLSVISPELAEVIYLQMRTITATYDRSDGVDSTELTIQHFQIDNQLHLDSHSVMLFPLPSKDDQNTQPPPFFKATVTRSLVVASAPLYTMVDLDIRPLVLQLDERVVLELAHFVLTSFPRLTQKDQLDNEEPHKALQLVLARAPVHVITDDADPSYFEAIRINSLEFVASFYTYDKLDPHLMKIKQDLSLGVMASFANAEVRLDTYLSQRTLVSLATLLNEIREHYLGLLGRQAYKVLFSLDFLGNPIGMVQNLTTGLGSFVAESASGNVLEGGKTLAMNVAQSIADSTSKLTASVSSGLSRLVDDPDYQYTRQKQKLTAKDSTLGYFSSGWTSFSDSVYSGVTGMAAPLLSNSSTGLGTTITRSLVGVVVKPVMGIFDMISDFSAGVRHSATNASEKPSPLRLPRVVGPDSVLRPYDREDAMGRRLMLMLNHQNQHEKFVAYVQLGVDEQAILITGDRFLILDTRGGPPPIVCQEVWFSGCYNMEVVRTDFLFYLQFRVSYQMIREIELSLSMDNKNAVRMTQPTWREDGGILIRIRCVSQALSQYILNRLQYANVFYRERTHLVTRYSLE